MLDKQAVAKSFGKAAQEYDEYARIQHRIADRLLLHCRQLQDNSNNIGAYGILDLGCGTGYCLPHLNELFPQTKIIGADLSAGMLAYAKQQYPAFEYRIADAEALPFERESLGMIFSNFAVQWCDAFSSVLAEQYRVLVSGGYLVLSTLVDGTLQELKQAWAQVDASQHVNDFESQLAIESAVKASSFECIQYSVNDEVEYYADLRSLTDSLKRIGAHNVTEGRNRGLTSRQNMRTFMQAFERYRQADGLPARYKVVSMVLRKP